MIIFPAIDIIEGKCVRLVEGNFAMKTVYSDDPSEVASRWEAEGAEFLHLVDLDGARAGVPQNLDIIEKIVRSIDIPVQIGGGIRTMDTINRILELGVERVILGSAAVKNPTLIEKACTQYGEHIVVGIDARDGVAAVNGWEETGGVKVSELAVRMENAGVKRIIYTDISRDGKLSGLNIEATRELAGRLSIPVIASGGIGGKGDIRALAAAKCNKLEGVIVGQALYAGRINLKEAIELARGGST